MAVRDVDIRIVTNDDGKIYHSDSIINIDIQRSITDGSFGIGYTQSDRLRFTVISSEKIPKMTSCTVFIRIDNGEFKMLGKFFADECTRDGAALTVTAYDIMYYRTMISVTFTGNTDKGLYPLTFPCSMQDVLDYICHYRGLRCSFVCQPFSVEKLPLKPDGTYFNVRDVIGFIASAHAANAKINSEGELVFKSFSLSDKSISSSDAVEFTLDDSQPFEVNGILFTVDSDTDIYIDDIPGSEYDEDNEGIIHCYNPFANVSVANYVWTRLGGLLYYGGSVKIRGKGELECGDVLEINNLKYPEDKEVYKMCITDIAYSISSSEGFTETLSSQAAKSGGADIYSQGPLNKSASLIVASEEPEDNIKNNDYWLEINNDTDKNAKHLYKCKLSEGNEKEWKKLAVFPSGGGVGENVGAHNERFNDYEFNTITDGDHNRVDGENNSLANSYHTSVSGELNEIHNSEASAVFGYHNKTWGGEDGYLKYSVVSGYGNKLTRVEYSLIYGGSNGVTDVSNTLIGGQNNVLYNTDGSFVCGQWNRVYEAQSCIVAGDYHSIPERESLKYTGLIVGGFSSDVTASAYNSHIPLLVIGNGAYEKVPTTRSNALRLTSDGALIIQGTLYPGGADYAETYEWRDGNPENEDRRGLFVTLDGDKIIKADGNSDYILGIVSSSPTVCGDTYNDHWKGKFKKDVFGSILYDENGNMIISEEFDPDKKYIPQRARPEKAYVGTHGKLVVTDDGTCIPDKYCKPSVGGVGTYSDDMNFYRVLERIDKNHVRVVIK